MLSYLWGLRHTLRSPDPESRAPNVPVSLPFCLP